MSTQQAIFNLKASAVIFMIFGLLSALAAWPHLVAPQRFLAEMILLDFSGSVTMVQPTERIMSAILGGIIFGWGMTIWQLVHHLYDGAKQSVHRIIMIGVSSWYILDSTASVVAGAPFNVVLNVSLWLVFAIPVFLASRPETSSA